MTLYELKRLVTYPLMSAFLVRVRNDLKALAASGQGKRLSVLDVGGRKSPYTIGLAMDVTILDIPRESEVQKELNLGLTEGILKSIQKNRSNVVDLVLEDMTRTTLPPHAYDAVVCVEVIEHVPNDRDFVKNIAMVVKKGGWAYFTTPNGDYIKNEPPNYNPDHLRHYKKVDLEHLLQQYFDDVVVLYAIKTGKFRVWGLPGYSVKRPLRTIKAIVGNVLNRWESKYHKDQKQRSAHLIAIAYKH